MSGTGRTHEALLALDGAAEWETIISLTGDLSASDPPGFWFFRAGALAKVQRGAEAVATARQGLAKNPASAWGNQVLFEALNADGQTDAAFRHYRSYIETHEDTEDAKAFYVQQAAELNLLDIAAEMNEKRDVIKDVPKKPRFALGIQCFCKHDTLEEVFASLCDLDGADRFSLILLQDSAYLSNNPEKYADGVKKVRDVIANWLPRLMMKFFSVECLENKRNLGTAPTCRRLIDYITERHDGFLFIEDDCILARSALDWTVHHLEHTISSNGPWFVTCESIFFDKEHRLLDDNLKPRLANIATYEAFRESYIQLGFVNSTCFGTRSDIWKKCAGPRSFTRGPESLTRFVAQKGMKTIAPMVPRASDIGMLHELGYSVGKMGAANVRETKSVYLMCASPFVGDLCDEFIGDKDLIYRATSKLVPESVEAIEDKYASGDLTDLRVADSTCLDRTNVGEGSPSDSHSAELTATACMVLGTHSSLKSEMPLAAPETGATMLEKTRALLADVKPGTYLSDEIECYDPGEIDALGAALNRLLYAPSSIRRVLQQKYGVTITRADFYSEIPTIVDLEKSFASPSLLKLDGIFPDNATMVAELDRLTSVSHEFNPPVTATRPGEFAWEGGPFSYSDAMSYYAMIRTRKPRTIVEIGSSGWSTLIAQMACEKNGMGRIICIEPNPSESLKAMSSIELIERRAQDIETPFFTSLLRDGDLLFIDSSHTVKHDSDCLHIYLRLLPSVEADITVHVHDIFLPDTLSLNQMRDNQVSWNEQYLLYAYMSQNPRTRTIYGSRYHGQRNPERLERFMQGRYRAGGASFWFEQKKGAAT